MVLAFSCFVMISLFYAIAAVPKVPNVRGTVLKDSYVVPKDYIQQAVPNQFPLDYYDRDPVGYLYHFTKFCRSETKLPDCLYLVSLVYFGNDPKSMEKAIRGTPDYLGTDVVDTYLLKSSEDIKAVTNHIHPLRSVFPIDPSRQKTATRHQVAVYYEDTTCLVITYDLIDNDNRNYAASGQGSHTPCEDSEAYVDNIYVRRQWEREHPQPVRSPSINTSPSFNRVPSNVGSYVGQVLDYNYELPWSYARSTRDCEWEYNPPQLHGHYTFRFEEHCVSPTDCIAVVLLSYTENLIDRFLITSDNTASWFNYPTVQSIEIRSPTVKGMFLTHHILVRKNNKECKYRTYEWVDGLDHLGFHYKATTSDCHPEQRDPSPSWQQVYPGCPGEKNVPARHVSFNIPPPKSSASTSPVPPPSNRPRPTQSIRPVQPPSASTPQYTATPSKGQLPPQSPRPTVDNDRQLLRQVPSGMEQEGVLVAGVHIPPNMQEATRYDHHYIKGDKRYSQVMSKYCNLAGKTDLAKPKVPIYDDKSCVFIMNIVFNEFVLDYFQVCDDRDLEKSYDWVQVIPQPLLEEVKYHKVIVHMSNGDCWIRGYKLVELFKFDGKWKCSEDVDYREFLARPGVFTKGFRYIPS